jgi:hypothetical protein
MITVTFPVEVGNRFRDSPTMRNEIAALFERVQPEQVYVTLMNRIIYMVVDTETPEVLGDIHMALANIAEAEPTCEPVVPGPTFTKISNELSEQSVAARAAMAADTE